MVVLPTCESGLDVSLVGGVDATLARVDAGRVAACVVVCVELEVEWGMGELDVTGLRELGVVTGFCMSTAGKTANETSTSLELPTNRDAPSTF